MVCVLFLSGCTLNNDWRVIVYPDDNAPGEYHIGTEFSDISGCTEAGKKETATNPKSSFACGQGCKSSKDGLYLCDKTLYRSHNLNPR